MNLVKNKSEAVEMALAVGRKQHLTFRLIRLSETLDEDNPFVVYEGEFQSKPWLFLPRKRDRSYVPLEADRRAGLLKEAGFEIGAEFVGHPEPEFEPAPDETPQRSPVDWHLMSSEVGKVVITEFVSAVKAAATATVALVVGMVGALNAIDPSLVCVIRCADGFAFIEVCRWNEE